MDDYDMIWNEEENDNYSFEISLIQATVENNTEAVEFLLQEMQVNAYVQTNHSIIKKYSYKCHKTKQLKTMYGWKFRCY